MEFKPRADLRYAELRNRDLRGVNLAGANLSRTLLVGSDFQGADLRDADLSLARAQDCNFGGANLSRAILNDTLMTRCNLKKANLEGANMFRANLIDADIRGANMRGAYMNQTNLHRADARDADLTGADLRTAHVEATCFDVANLSETCLDPRIAPNGEADDFRRDASGWVVGYRTAKPIFMSGPKYKVGRLYKAPIFSTSHFECHPGLYLYPRIRDVVFEFSNREIIKVITCPEDIHKVGMKYRTRWFAVLREIDTRLTENLKIIEEDLP